MRHPGIIMALSLLAAPLAPLGAQGWIEPVRPVPGPWDITRVRSSVSVTVRGRVALVEVEEWFRNDGLGLGEGDYIYPLPGEAVFSNFSLYQGDQELRGETMDAGQARSIYEEIVRKRRDPALIELAGHGMIRARVFPIPSGETRRITLRYTQLMDRSGDAYRFRYAGPRSGGIIRTSSESSRSPGSAGGPVEFVLEVEEADRYGDPFSPTHDLDLDRSDDLLRVRPRSSLVGDLTVFLPLVENAVGVTVATYREVDEDGYFMLTLSPRPSAEANDASRDVTAVVDVSGSMSGSKLRQAQRALKQMLNTLNSGDRFRLIAFSNRVRGFRSGWTEVSPRNMREAAQWVDRLVADGGTNIAGALREALDAVTPETHLPIVLFLTDGIPSVGEEDPERIAQEAEAALDRARIFTFGIGYDVNTYLLDRLSQAGRGSTEYVETVDGVERAMGHLVRKIQHPVLTDLEIAASTAQLEQVHPARLPDLFAGEELVVFGRYREDRPGVITVSGNRNGERESFRLEVSLERLESESNDFIPRLWASRKIGALSRQVRLGEGSPELVAEIKRTALRYGLLSEYTSYLVQEPPVLADSPQPLGGGRGAPQASFRAAAPAAATGASAVRKASRDQQLREASSAEELARAEDALRRDGNGRRTVAGRIFQQKGSLWEDIRHDPDNRVVRIAPFSPAYFEIIRRMPEIMDYLHEFEHLLVAGESVSIEITPDGREALSALELRDLVKDFRSS